MLCIACPLITEQRVKGIPVMSSLLQGMRCVETERLIQLIAFGRVDKVHLSCNVLFSKLIHGEVPVSRTHHFWGCNVTVVSATFKNLGVRFCLTVRHATEQSCAAPVPKATHCILKVIARLQ